MSNNTTDKPAFFVVRDAIYASGLKPNLRFVLTTLCDGINTDRGDWKVWPSQKTLASRTGFGERSIRNHTHTLKELGFLSIESKKCKKGEYYVYTISHQKLGLPKKVGKAPANHDMAPATLAQAPAESADKEQIGKSKGKKELLSEGTAPTASAGEKTSVLPETPKAKAEVITQNFTTSGCRDDHAKTGLRFYMDCGRHHSDADHFHKPENPKRPLTRGQIASLRHWFKALPDSGCAVMNYAMENWPRLREVHRVGQTTPTISALEKAGYKELLDSLQASQHAASLKRVERNLQSAV